MNLMGTDKHKEQLQAIFLQPLCETLLPQVIKYKKLQSVEDVNKHCGARYSINSIGEAVNCLGELWSLPSLSVPPSSLDPVPTKALIFSTAVSCLS